MASKRAKLIAQRDRERKFLDGQKEIVELKANYERLSTMTSNFSRLEVSDVQKELNKKKLKHKQRQIEMQQKFGQRLAIEKPLPARIVGLPKVKKQESYDDPLLAQREEQAQEKYKEMKSRTAPVGNKMGYQYLTQTDVEEFKLGLHRRR